MDLEQWKQGVHHNLQQLGRTIGRLTPGMVYGAMCSASLLPVITAAQQDYVGALVALGSALGAVGGNLVGNQLQRWYDRSEAELAAELGQRAAADPQWLETLDALLAKFEAPQVVQADLTDADRKWFVSALQEELTRLGNLSRYEALLEGSGTIVQGSGNVAAGAYGTAIGTVEGNVYFGPPARNPAEAIAIYRRVYAAGCRPLPLRGVDVGASDPKGGRKQIDLDQVYIALDTTAQIDEETLQRSLTDSKTLLRFNLSKGGAIEHIALYPAEQRQADKLRPLPALTAVTASPRAVLLGGPGSGKSTFLGHLGLCLALQGLDPAAGWLERMPGWPAGQADLIPITVLLRDFARGLPQAKGKATPQMLWNFLAGRLTHQNLEFVAKPLHAALEEGRAIVLLDGLDEIPSRGQRTLVRDAVAAFAARYPRCRLVITCRTLTYQDAAWQLEDIPAYELASFDEPKIDHFITAWYHELARAGMVKLEEVEPWTERLRTAVRRPDLRRLAPNPLLLTVMALVHTHKGQLPDARALLYEETVDILLWRWEQIKPGGDEDEPALRRLLLDAGRTDVDLKRVLWRLAYEAHRQSRTGDDEALADIGELQLEKALSELHPEQSRDWATRVVEAMKLRAGLLLERTPEVYTFPHRTFQEYLAGAHLAAQSNFAAQAVDQMGEPALWWEVILLAVGRLVYLGGDMDKPLALVGELCQQRIVDDNRAWKQAWLAGDVLREIGLNRVRDSALGRDLLERVQGRLGDLLATDKLTARERAAAGVTLAKLGDPRKEVLTVEHMPFCFVPGGAFWMGDGKEQHRCEATPADYWIGRYPVTNAQYGVFVQAGGYREPSYWPEAKLAGFWQPGQFKGRYDDDWRSGPVEFREPFGLPNHPVVSVTWYEALAFSRWFTELLKRKELLAPGWAIHLPSEAEWEKAARGGLHVPAEAVVRSLTEGLQATVSLVKNLDEKRGYPWIGQADPDRANCGDAGIGATSAVGCFERGASPYGCLDMAGNVWEWTRSLYADYPYPAGGQKLEQRENLAGGINASRVLRGGSYLNDDDDVRCAARIFSNPSSGSSNFGFRVIASP